MSKNLIDLVKFLVKEGVNTPFLDKLAHFFNVDAVSIVALKDFDITFAVTSNFFKENSIDILKLYRQTKYNNVYFERSIKKGYCIVKDYQNSKLANPLWKDTGLKSVFLYRLDTDFNSIIALESFKRIRVFDEDDLKNIRFLSPFVSRVIENSIFRGLLEKEIVKLDISPPPDFDKDTLKLWLKENLLKIMDITKAKAVSFVNPKHGVYSFIAGKKGFDFIKFKKTKDVEKLLTYRMYKEGLRAPVVFFYSKSSKTPECLKRINAELGIRNVLVLPIWENGALEGVFGYGYQTDMHFSVYDVNLVSLITRRLSQILKMSLEFGKLNKIITESEEDIINSFVLTIEMRDVYTKGHSQRVAFYAKRIAQKLGLNRKFVDKVYIAGLLHDVGKIGIPDAVLMKPSKLSDVEYEMIKYHPVLSYEIVSQFKSLKDLKTIAKMVRHHHERCDGKGYPDGLLCDEISKGARILAIADVFDALTTSRPYRDAFSPEKAIEIIMNDEGHFDKVIFSRTLNVLKISFEEATKLGESSLIPKAFDEYKRKFSHVDSLTGLLTRSALLDRLCKMFEGGEFFRIFMVDVKGMDGINIECGNLAGDMLLVNVADKLKELKSYGCKHFSRYGGDSFVFVCNNKFQKIGEFLGELSSVILNDIECPKKLSFTIAHADSNEVKDAQHLITLLRSRKNFISHGSRR